MPSDEPHLTNAELVQLRIRVIALENLLMAVLAEASDRQLELAREMAAFISPRPGYTHHPLTIQASGHMLHLVERAGQFRGVPAQSPAPIRSTTRARAMRRNPNARP